MTPTREDVEHLINLGQWYDDGSGPLDDLLVEAEEAWVAAGEGRGPWKLEVDVADLTKLIKEVLAWRATVGLS